MDETPGPIKNTNIIHRSRLSKMDKLSLYITSKAGSMGFFFFCIFLVAIPLFLSSSISVVHYISSGILQLVLLPLILISQNLQSRHAELRADHDFETNVKTEKEIKTIHMHLEKQDKMLQDIARRIEKLESRGK